MTLHIGCLCLTMILLASGCNAGGEIENTISDASSRFEVSREWSGEGRNLFLVRDTQTGHEYIVVDGIQGDVAITPLLEQTN
jgi:hypothetical protein